MSVEGRNEWSDVLPPEKDRCAIAVTGTDHEHSYACGWNDCRRDSVRLHKIADQSLRAALGKLAAEWREGNGDYPESLKDCANEIDHLLAQASNASSLAKELQAKPAAGTPTTKGDTK